ncbi:MAG: thioesterase family protein [Alphaproteobacteria bacterium]|nr:thioesterase family protein [Alphaproteobacteria bacterium]
MRREDAPARDSFKRFHRITTRWMDQDPFGHVNNVEYYSYFDTAVNEHLIREAGLSPRDSAVVGMVVDTQCSFFRELTFPEAIDVGLRVAKLGTTSVTYEIGVFRDGEPAPAAYGRFVHVYVERETMRPMPIPDAVRKALAPVLADQT